MPRVSAHADGRVSVTAASTRLSDDDHVVRYCKPSSLSAGRPTALSFSLRHAETYLSVRWLECFGVASRTEALAQVRKATARRLRLARNGRLAVLPVGPIRALRLDGGDRVIVKHLGEDHDLSHTGLFAPPASRLAMATGLARLASRRADVAPAVLS